MAKKSTIRKMTTWAQWAAGAVTTVSAGIEAVDHVRSWLTPSPVVTKALSVAEPAQHGPSYLLTLLGVGVVAVVLVRVLGRIWESKSLD
jgi:hypothetical protein